MKTIIFRNFIVVLLFATMLASTSSYAQTSSWIFKDIGNGNRIAQSVNSDLSRAGVYCDVNQGCQSFISMNSPCDTGATIPLMANSSKGAYIFTATCNFVAGNQYLIIEQFDDAIGIFESGSEIGFAAPMKDGKFIVTRFSTLGAVSAIKKARAAPTTQTTTKTVPTQVL
jgi:hypothetical protein